MAEPNWLRHSIRLGVVGFRRSIRGIRRHPLRLRLLGFAAITGMLGFGGTGVLLALVLRSHAGPISVPGHVRLGVSGLWIFGGWFTAQRAILHRRRLPSESFVLTTVSRRTAAVGMLITEFLNVCAFLALPSLLILGAIGYAFLSPASLLFIPLAIGLFAASALVVGNVLGFGYLFLAVRSRSVAQQEGKLVVQLILVLIAGYLLMQPFVPVPASWERATFDWVPISWLVDIAVIGTPVTGSRIRAIAGFIGTLVGVGGGSLAVEKLATAYWDTDLGVDRRGTDTVASSVRGQDEGTLAAAISPFIVPSVIDIPTQRVAELVVLRLRRSPRRLLFLITIIIWSVILLGVFATELAQPMALVPVVCALFIPWLSGATFGLNPLGDEGAVLPATLTSSISGRQFVRGMMLPGVSYGLPLTVICTLVSSVMSPYTLIVRGGLILIGAVLTVVAAALAPAIGMQFPQFSAYRIEESHEVVPPSLTAVAIYTLFVSVLGGGTVLLLLAPPSIYSVFEASGAPVAVVRGVVVMCGLGVVMMGGR